MGAQRGPQRPGSKRAKGLDPHPPTLPSQPEHVACPGGGWRLLACERRSGEGNTIRSAPREMARMGHRGLPRTAATSPRSHPRELTPFRRLRRSSVPQGRGARPWGVRVRQAPGPRAPRREWRARPSVVIVPRRPAPGWPRTGAPLSHKYYNPASVLKPLPYKVKRRKGLKKRTQVYVCICYHGSRFNCTQM